MVTRRITAGLTAGAALTLALSAAAPALAGYGAHGEHGEHGHGGNHQDQGHAPERAGRPRRPARCRRAGSRPHPGHRDGRDVQPGPRAATPVAPLARCSTRRRGPASSSSARSPRTSPPRSRRATHGTIWLLTGGASPDEPAADNGATLFKWKPGWAAPVAFADIAGYQRSDPDPYDLEDLPADSNPSASRPCATAASWSPTPPATTCCTSQVPATSRPSPG